MSTRSDESVLDRTHTALEMSLPGSLRRRIAEQRQKASAAVSDTTLAPAAPVGIAFGAMDGTWQQVNANLAKMLGYGQAELVNAPRQAVGHPDELTAEEQKLAQLSRGEVSDLTYEKRYRRKDGSFFNARVCVSQLRRSTGVGIGLIHLIEDYSREATSPRQNRQAHRMELLEDLADEVLAELRQALREISEQAQALKGQLAPYEEELRCVAQTERIAGAAARIGALNESLFSFIQAAEAEPEVFDLAELVIKNSELITHLIGPGTEVTIDAQACPITGIRRDLEQVLLGLVANADRAMPKGGELALRIEPLELPPGPNAAYPGAAPGAYAELCVTDSGQGMSADQIEQLQAPLAGAGTTGISLEMVRQTVRAHRGCIVVDSKPGRGTSLSILFPAAAAEQRPKQRDRQRQAQAPETILLVDDEPHVRQFLKRFLSASGFSVLTAANGQEALDIYHQNAGEIDVVVTDMSMPGLGGGALAQEIADADDSIKLILISGNCDLLDDVKAQLPQATLLPKPFTPDQLNAAVSSAFPQA